MATNIVLKRSASADAAPTTSDLELGELALNTYDGKIYMKKSVSGSESIVNLSGARAPTSSAFSHTTYKYTASGSTTTFSGTDDDSKTLAYTAGQIQVFLNGILLDASDYTASNGTSVVLSSATGSGSILYVISFEGTNPFDYFKYTATSGQTSFSGNDANSESLLYTVGNIAVYLNGVLLDATDYTATSGTAVVLASGATSGDILTVWEFNETGLSDLTTDTSPQLGGDLDVVTYDIVSTSNRHIDIVPHGTGNVTLQTDTVQLGSSAENVTVTTNSTGDLTLNTNSGTNSGSIVIADGANNNITLTPNGSGNIVLDTHTWPNADGSANQVLQTNGSGVLSFTTISSAAITDTDNDTKIQVEEGSDDDTIRFDVSGTEQIRLIDGVLRPTTDNDIDLGTSSIEFKDAFFDGTVTSDAFAGPLTGDVTGDLSGTATLATSVTVSANNSTDETVYPVFVDGATGTQGAETDTGLTYNPSSGTLTSSIFVGNITGNVTGNTSGTAATVTTAAQPAITSLGTLTTLTVDDITINGSTISDAGDFTLDIGGDILLNADGGDIRLQDGSATVAILDMSSNNLTIKNNNNDKDLIFNGYDSDGGGLITALTLDMSEAGAATFTSTVTASGFVGNVTGNASGTAATVTTAAQTAITSLGSLTGLDVNGAVTINDNLSLDGSNKELRFYEGANYVGFEAPALSANQIWVLPTADGSANQTLKTDGSGNLSWATAASAVSNLTDVTLSSLASNDYLRYNGSAWVNTSQGSNPIVNTMSGDGSDTTLTLTQAPLHENATLVTIDGVVQHKSTYSVSGATLTFSTAPPDGSAVECITNVNTNILNGNDVAVDTMTGDNSDTTLTLSVTPTNENHVNVYWDGVYQHKDNWSLSGTTITFATAPGTGVKVEAVSNQMMSAGTATGLTATAISGLTQVSAVAADHLLLYDATDGALKKALFSDALETATSISTSADAVALTFSSAEDATFAGHVILADSKILKLGNDTDLQIHHTSGLNCIDGSAGDIRIRNYADDSDIILQSDDGSGGLANYVKAAGNTGAVSLYHYGSAKLATVTGGINVTGDTDTDTLTVSGNATVGGTLGVTGAITGNLTGNVTGNTSGTAATVTGAAQSAITSVGTLTTLTVDDITINGSEIVDQGGMTIAGETLTFRTDASDWGTAITIDDAQAATFSGDVQAAGLYVGSTNTSYDFYNNGTSYLNGAVIVDDTLTAGITSITHGSTPYLDLKVGSTMKGRFYADANQAIIEAVGNSLILKSASTTALTFNSSQNATFAGTITSTGVTTGNNQDISVGGILKGSDSTFQILTSTSDGSDSSRIRMCGGGGTGSSRGAQLELQGNEHTFVGEAQLSAGDVSGAFVGISAPHSSGYITLGQGGSEIMRVHSNSNVGIGEIAPNDRLQVSGTITSQHNIVSNSTYDLFAARSTRTSNDYGGLDKQYLKMYLATPGSGTTGESSAHAYGDLRLAFTDGVDTTLDDKFTFRYNGNFGIGTTTPAKKLHLGGTAPGDSIIRQDATSSGTNWEIGERAAGKYQFWEDDNDGVRLTITSTGNIGIGTESPSQRLTVRSSGYGSWPVYVERSANGAQLAGIYESSQGDGGHGMLYLNDGSGNTDVKLSTNGPSYFNGGNVGIGESSPDARLTVAGTNRGATGTDADDATGNEKQIYLIEGSMGGRVGEWIHSTKAVAPSGGTQTAMISWYKFVLPGGYSDAGTPGFLEITNHMTGMHASGAAVEQYKILFPNAGSSNSAHGGMNLAYVDKVYALTRDVGSYSIGLTTVFYYLNSGSGTSGGTLYMKVTHASREPFFTMHARYIGGHGNNQGYHQYMAFLGTEVTNDHAPANITALTTNVGQGVQ